MGHLPAALFLVLLQAGADPEPRPKSDRLDELAARLEQIQARLEAVRKSDVEASDDELEEIGEAVAAAENELTEAEKMREAARRRREVSRNARRDAADFKVHNTRAPGGYEGFVRQVLSQNLGPLEEPDSRTCWKYDKGDFTVSARFDWLETGPGFRNPFKEVIRTDRYVELARPAGAHFTIVRLYDDQCWVKQPHDVTFKKYYEGGWVEGN